MCESVGEVVISSYERLLKREVIELKRKLSGLKLANDDLQTVLFGLYHLAKPYADDGENTHLIATLHEAAKQLEKYGELK